MNAIRTYTASALGLGLLVVASACEFSVAAENAVKYEMAPESAEHEWVTGRGLIVDGLNGEIEVSVGTEPGKVGVTFEPFTIRGADERPEAEQEVADHLTRSVALDENGDILVKTSKDGGGSSLGALITVTIPPEFDGRILVAQENGDVEIMGVARATGVVVTNDGAGDCVVVGAPTVVSTAVTCGFDIQVTGVSDHVDINATSGLESSTVRVELAALSPAAPDSTIHMGAGSVALRMPSGASYTLTAQANDGGTVDLNDLDGGNCEALEAAAGSKSMTCGTETDVPNIEVVAGEDGSGQGNIEVRY